MATRTVQIRTPGNFGWQAVWQKIEQTMERIRQRAFELFQQRGSGEGNEFEDWFRAERDLFFFPPSELAENSKEYILQVSAPGYTADQLVVGVEPDCVTVQGKAEARQERERKNCLFSEFSSQEIFRRFALPGPINPDAVKATLEDGMLKIVMPRAEAAQPKAQAA